MRKSYVLLAILGLLCLSSSEYQGVDKYNYYFFENNTIKDVRDYSTVAANVLQGNVKILDQENFVIKKDLRFQAFDQNNKQIYNITHPRNTFISPDWKYSLIVKDNDLWMKTLDLNTGEFSSENKVTELGIFNSSWWSILSWYEDQIVLLIDNKYYILNLISREIKPISNKSYISIVSASPTNRFDVWTNDTYYDFESETFHEVSDIGTMNRFYFNDFETGIHTIDGLTKMQNSSIRIFDLRTPDELKTILLNPNEIPNLPVLSKAYKTKWRNVFFTNRMYEKSGNRSKAISPNGKFISYVSGPAPASLIVRNIEEDTDIIWEEDFEESMSSGFVGLTTNRDVMFEWASNTEIIYAKKGDVLTQGTWVFDVTTGEKRKITSYVASEIIVFDKIGEVLILANNNIYKCNSDGSGLNSLSENVRNDLDLRKFIY